MRISDWSSDVCSSDLLSALHPRYEYLQAARVRDELIPNVIELAKAARAVNIPLMIDAEECDRLEPHMDVFAALLGAGIADEIGRASCRKACVGTCSSWWVPFH